MSTTTPSSEPAPPKAKIDGDSSPIPTTADKKKRAPRAKAPNRDVQISKALSKLLRHDAEKHKLKLDEEGFAELDKVVSPPYPKHIQHEQGGREEKRKLMSAQLQIPIIKSLKVTIDDIHHSVQDNAKQRFALRPSVSATNPPTQSDPTHFLIRANQGHSIPLSSAALLTKLTPETVSPTVVHGTYHALYHPILEAGGLRAMSRNHIHFSKGLPEDTAADVISGMRNDAELLFYIDVQKSMKDGVDWWISDNGVVLTEGDKEGKIGPKYWKKVVGRKGGVGTLWEDGVEVANMPEDVKGKRVPVGKVAHAKKENGGNKPNHRGGKKHDRGGEQNGTAVADAKQEKVE